MTQKKPELLAPAGSAEALDAAIRAGADAVYFGGSRFNARIFADNFGGDSMREAIRKCAFYGVKSNITLNTMPYEKEEADVLTYAEELYRYGADALICADLGTARLIHTYFPDFALHASTQAMGHNTDAARFFAENGFSRMVAARELSFEDLRTLCETSPIETELFIHGAICVSQSGGCLFSSLVGGRSGNRGACAQPCRLPYAVTLPEKGKGNEGYPLSLRDMCLASHIPELLSLGASSFKIEGRMKSPAYVGGVVRIYRRLLDEGRNAEKEELDLLAALFSRGGFTDGYFTKKIGSRMQGTRSDSDKEKTAAAEKEVTSGRQEIRRIPVSVSLTMRAGEPLSLTMAKESVSVTVSGGYPERAETRETGREDLYKSITKLGSTPFSAADVTITAEGGLSCPLSSVNALRREAAEKLEKELAEAEPHPERTEKPARFADGARPAELSGRKRRENGDYKYAKQAFFLFPERIPKEAASYFDLLFVPLEAFVRSPDASLARGVNGVTLPPVLFDRELAAIRPLLAKAREYGILHAQISNAGHIAQAKAMGFILHGDHRFNLYTAHSCDVLADAGLSDLVLSAELTAPQIRDIAAKVPTGAIVYGRVPLMTLERCILREAAHVPDGKPCLRCEKNPVSVLTDRRHTEFPVTRAYSHRNIVWNSSPVWMADRQEVLSSMHTGFSLFLFTTETEGEIAKILSAYKNGTETVPYPGFPAFRRIR